MKHIGQKKLGSEQYWLTFHNKVFAIWHLHVPLNIKFEKYKNLISYSAFVSDNE